MSELSAIELRQIRHEARRQLLSILCGDADDATQIGKRAVLLGRLHGCDSLRDKSQRELAELLGVSESAISQRLSFLRRSLM